MVCIITLHRLIIIESIKDKTQENSTFLHLPMSFKETMESIKFFEKERVPEKAPIESPCLSDLLEIHSKTEKTKTKLGSRAFSAFGLPCSQKLSTNL